VPAISRMIEAVRHARQLLVEIDDPIEADAT
jgi:hypothetical protein